MADANKYKKIQFFLRFINFNWNLIKKYLKYTEPLTRLTEKDKLFAKPKNKTPRLLN